MIKVGRLYPLPDRFLSGTTYHIKLTRAGAEVVFRILDAHSVDLHLVYSENKAATVLTMDGAERLAQIMRIIADTMVELDREGVR